MADLSRKERIPTKNAMNTRGNTRETRGEHERNHSTNKESITQVLDHRIHRVTYDPQSTKVRIQRTVHLLTEVLMVFPREGS